MNLNAINIETYLVFQIHYGNSVPNYGSKYVISF